MQVDYLIIGQGISGTWLSYYLQKERKSFLVIDNNDRSSPSRIAAGIINPVTGRRHVTVWMADELLSFAWKSYTAFGQELGITAISHKNIIDFFPSPQMRISFMQRVEEKSPYVHSYAEQNQFNPLFNYDFGCGEIRPVYIVHLEILLPAWRKRLEESNSLLEETFEPGSLKISADSVQYKDIKAGQILFCDGNNSSSNHYFDRLPFAPNKGEVLIVDIPDLPPTHIYKRGMMLAPLAKAGLWWIGSNYAWEFKDAAPTREFREQVTQLLGNWLKPSFKIIDHFSSLRPATLERRPFAGLHPHYPAVGILNGMGTKGCSLAPFFANQLVDLLLRGEPITAEADIGRFTKLLAKKQIRNS